MSLLADKNPRARSIDALRGYAIATMVLSAYVAWGRLPAWMYHAQTPPPNHVYDAAISGLTWVDLVFPFFLFALGAALPFSVGRKAERGESMAWLCGAAVLRWLKLAFFAVFIEHFNPYVLSSAPDVRAWLLSISCFVLLFPMFARFPQRWSRRVRIAIRVAAWVAAVTMLLTTRYAHGASFSLFRSNIIIYILAGMALTGTLAYLATRRHRAARCVVMGLALALALTAELEGSWVQRIASWIPRQVPLTVDHLRYLVLVLGGSLAGEEIFVAMHDPRCRSRLFPRWRAAGLAVVSVVATIGTLWGTFSDRLEMTFWLNGAAVLCGLGLLYGTRRTGWTGLWRRLFVAGAVCLLLGLALEPLQGGIKKDPATVGYLLSTTGLAFWALLVFSILCDGFACRRSTAFLTLSGENPMIAYTAGGLLVIPLLQVCGIFEPATAWLVRGAWTGFLQGVILTAAVIGITLFFSKKHCFWRT